MPSIYNYKVLSDRGMIFKLPLGAVILYVAVYILYCLPLHHEIIILITFLFTKINKIIL